MTIWSRPSFRLPPGRLAAYPKAIINLIGAQ
jgi:hypothetical protein